jgi:hypothetical protein
MVMGHDSKVIGGQITGGGVSSGTGNCKASVALVVPIVVGAGDSASHARSRIPRRFGAHPRQLEADLNPQEGLVKE